MEAEQQRLLAIAKGCRDYGGGHRNDPVAYDAFQHGINTVIRSLSEAINNPDDTQVMALRNIGNAK